MATLSIQRVGATGTAITKAAAAAGGDRAACGERSILVVANGGGSSINVTIAVPGNDRFGNAKPDLVVAVAAGTEKWIPLREADFADPSDQRAAITYSSVTSVTVANVTL